MCWPQHIRKIPTPSGEFVKSMEATILLLTIEFGLLVVTFDALRRFLIGAVERLSRSPSGDVSATAVVRAVERADRLLPGTRACLARSLAAEMLLRRHGHVPDHRIGVTRREGETVEAHSWLTLDGEVVIGDLDDLSQYEQFPSLDARDHP